MQNQQKIANVKLDRDNSTSQRPLGRMAVSHRAEHPQPESIHYTIHIASLRLRVCAQKSIKPNSELRNIARNKKKKSHTPSALYSQWRASCSRVSFYASFERAFDALMCERAVCNISFKRARRSMQASDSNEQ